MAEHSIFAPSGLSRVLSCPASFKESQTVPKEKSSTFAQRGTLLHEMFTEVWSSYVASDQSGMANIFTAHEIDPVDAQYVLSCCDYVKAQLITCGPRATINLEQHVTLATWGLPDVWGTADVVIRDPDNDRMIVDDHKFGQGVPVYAEDNIQLMTYLAGASGFPPEYAEYNMSIIQPPLNIYSDYKISAEELKNFVNRLALGIEQAKSPDAPYHPTENNCRFCPAKNKCRARYDMATKEAQEVFSIAKRMPDVTVEDKARLAEMLTNLEQVKKALFADMHATILEGGDIPGWKLVAGRSIRKWGDEGVAMKWLLDNKAIKEDDLFEEKFISPSKAEKLNRKLKKSEDFGKLVVKPVGNPQLVRQEDKRESYVPADKAVDVFKPLD